MNCWVASSSSLCTDFMPRSHFRPVATGTIPAAPSRNYGTRHNPATLPTVAALAGVVAALYFGREVFLPLAIAFLLTFALAPVVSILRRLRFPRILAVGTAVLMAFAALGLFAFILVMQVTDMARNVNDYQANILSKVQALKSTGTSPGLIERVGSAIEKVGEEIEKESTPAPSRADAGQNAAPMKVELISRQRPVDVLQALVGPLVEPVATAGLIIVVVIFMLLEREDLRDRFIRLVGYGDLHRTTEALEDAGRRVGQYLLMQLVVNLLYAVPVGIGLWIIGLPNALLWALLTLVLRFVPYIGPAIGMLLPMFLAVAVDPGWTMLAWTAALFLTMELISNNIIEPWLYGSRTGLSPLAVIVAAIFWTWLWGPLGLVLSTPLTVCLVVLGKHVPQFAFLEVLFADNQVLDAHARLYQRLLAGDPDEAADQAEEFLANAGLATYYTEIALPALLLAERDRARGVLSEDQLQRVIESAETLMASLEEIAAADGPEQAVPATPAAAVPPLPDDNVTTARDNTAPPPEPASVTVQPDARHALVRPASDPILALSRPTLEEHAPTTPRAAGARATPPCTTVACAGGRTAFDDIAASMLAQVLRTDSQELEVQTVGHAALDLRQLRGGELGAVDTVLVGYLNADSAVHARLVVRRLKRFRPALQVGIIFWGAAGTRSLDERETEELTSRLNADFVATALDDVLERLPGCTPASAQRPSV